MVDRRGERKKEKKERGGNQPGPDSEERRGEESQ